MSKRQQSRRQKQMRRRHGENAHIFDKDLTQALAEVECDSWEFAIALAGGNVPAAAEICGLEGIPRSAKVLWGRSAEAALGTYRAWRRRRGTPNKRATHR